MFPTPHSRLVDWELSGHRLPPAGSQLPPSPYIEPPTIPEGMTVAEYRRARLPRTKHASLHLFRWLERVAGFRERRTGLPGAIFFLLPHHTATTAGV
jgi:hypothetical protein